MFAPTAGSQPVGVKEHNAIEDAGGKTPVSKSKCNFVHGLLAHPLPGLAFRWVDAGVNPLCKQQACGSRLRV